VLLDLAAAAALDVLKPPLDSIKGVADRHIEILMGVVLARIATDHHFMTWHRHIHPHVVDAALMMVAMGRLDHHPAGDEIRRELFQFPHALMDAILNGWRAVQVAVGNFDGNLHENLRMFD
jgi:hypothetical protein